MSRHFPRPFLHCCWKQGQGFVAWVAGAFPEHKTHSLHPSTQAAPQQARHSFGTCAEGLQHSRSIEGIFVKWKRAEKHSSMTRRAFLGRTRQLLPHALWKPALLPMLVWPQPAVSLVWRLRGPCGPVQPLLAPDSLQGCERDPRSAASRVPSLSHTDRCHTQGHIPEPPEDRSRGWAATHQPLQLQEP